MEGMGRGVLGHTHLYSGITPDIAQGPYVASGIEPRDQGKSLTCCTNSLACLCYTLVLGETSHLLTGGFPWCSGDCAMMLLGTEPWEFNPLSYLPSPEIFSCLEIFLFPNLSSQVPKLFQEIPSVKLHLG